MTDSIRNEKETKKLGREDFADYAASLERGKISLIFFSANLHKNLHHSTKFLTYFEQLRELF